MTITSLTKTGRKPPLWKINPMRRYADSPVAKVLPPEAAQRLRDAAMTKLDQEVGECRDRTIAVDRAIKHVKALYPEFFKKEQ